MAKLIDISTARSQPGLRLVLTAGAPGPWGESIKGMLHVKKIPCIRVAQKAGEENHELVEWTGRRNAPQLVDEDDKSIHAWADLIYFAERRGATPRLIPEDFENRVLMFGLIHEIAGEDGFAWNRRYSMLGPVVKMHREKPNPALEGIVRMAQEYGYSDEAGEAAPGKVVSVLENLTARLQAQRKAGSPYFIADQISALDIYWACFAALIAPLPHEQCPMPDFLRRSYSTYEPIVSDAISPELLEHRDRIYREFLELPIEI